MLQECFRHLLSTPQQGSLARDGGGEEIPLPLPGIAWRAWLVLPLLAIAMS